MSAQPSAELRLQADIFGFYDDPLGYALYVWPWGVKGTRLEEFPDGPDAWQRDVMHYIRDEIRKDPEGFQIRDATASGHGIGKGALAAMLTHWFHATRWMPAGVTTANTQSQLRGKTMRELAIWNADAINSHWFQWTATRFQRVGYEASWYQDAVPNTEHNAQSFAGLHGTEVLVIFDEACHDEITEVMTDDGWKLFSDLDGSERLLTMSRDTHEAFYEKPSKLFKAYRDGPMLHYRAERGADFCVTPNHSMYYRTYAGRRASRRSDWKDGQIQHMSKANHFIPRGVKWSKDGADSIIIPGFQGARKLYAPLELNADLLMELMGWYYSEGHTVKTKRKDRVDVGSIGITNSEPEVIDRLVHICGRLGLPVSVYKSGRGACKAVHVRSRPLAEFLYSHGASCLTKRIPRFVRDASKRQINIFLDAFVCGDGYRSGEGREILYTSCEGLAGDLQELCLKGGSASTVVKRPLKDTPIDFGTHTSKSTADGYVVSRVARVTDLCFSQHKVEQVPYKGMIYCAEIPRHHLLYTRRNGKPIWSGNSTIPQRIFEVTQGAFSTPRNLWLLFGNPTENSGAFRDVFGRNKKFWNTRHVDSRTARMATLRQSNLEQFKALAEQYGEDSDFFKVRVKGEFPSQASTQFIPRALVDAARARDITPGHLAPKVMALDVARYGDDANVIARVHGRKLYPMKELRKHDLMSVSDWAAAEIIRYRPDIMFVDGVGVGGGVVDRLRQLGHDVIEVNGGESPSDAYRDRVVNKRAEMYWIMREWLRGADIPEHDDLLADELTSIEYGYDPTRMRLKLESKEDLKAKGYDSPDRADALSMCFAQPVAPEIESESGEPEELPDY